MGFVLIKELGSQLQAVGGVRTSLVCSVLMILRVLKCFRKI